MRLAIGLPASKDLLGTYLTYYWRIYWNDLNYFRPLGMTFCQL